MQRKILLKAFPGLTRIVVKYFAVVASNVWSLCKIIDPEPKIVCAWLATRESDDIDFFRHSDLDVAKLVILYVGFAVKKISYILEPAYVRLYPFGRQLVERNLQHVSNTFSDTS